MSVSRRSFLKSSAVTAAVTLAGNHLSPVFGAEKSSELKAGPGNKWPGRVVVNFNKNAATGSTVDETVAKKMVDDAIMLLTGETTVAAAWKAVFPSTLTAQSKIAIKTNILNAGIPCPHASTVQAITEGLLQMDIGGSRIPAGNITIYDMNNSSAFDKAGYTAGKFPDIKLVKDSAQKFGDGAMSDRAYAKTLNAADFLINVFSPRGHFIESKVTLGFKSHYGTYTDATGLHTNPSKNLRDINCTGPVYNKTVLILCSGLFGMNEGNGPTGGADFFSTYAKSIDSTITGDKANPTTIIMSTDPVSCDMQAMKVLRLNKASGKYGIEDMPAYLRASAGISDALSDATYNIGIIDETKMDFREIINGEVITSDIRSGKKLQLFNNGRLHVKHLRQQDAVFVEYAIPQQFIGSEATIEIFDLKGQNVFSASHYIAGVRNHFSWNMRTSIGSKASKGKYIVHVVANTVRLSDSFAILE